MIKLKDIMSESLNKNITDKIKSVDKIVMTADRTIVFKNKTQKSDGAVKPIGLWYSIGSEWINWVRSEMPSWERDNIFKVSLGSKILKLKTKSDVIKFTDTYGVELWGEIVYINWNEVAKKYNGIEIMNPRHFGNMGKLFWLYPWDVSSGCVWNSGGISKIQKV
jgi:hypothetical protein